jgi:hypothetical protein
MMYGPSNSNEKPKELPKVENNPLDLKFEPAGKSITIKHGDAVFIAASAMHTQELEREIQKLGRSLKNAENTNRRLMTAYNRLVAQVRNLEIELSNKVDKLV